MSATMVECEPESKVSCPHHSHVVQDVAKNNDCLEKIKNQQFWILLLLAMNLFFSGLATGIKIVQEIARVLKVIP